MTERSMEAIKHPIGKPKQRFAFLDVETTGTDDDAPLLELAIILTEQDSKHRWKPLAVYHHVFHFNPANYPGMVWEQHTKNGLLDECRISGTYAIMGVDIVLPEKTIAIGRNVHFDLNVLKRCLPSVHKQFHYRTLDLTTLEMVHGQGEKIESTHRALHDCMLEMHQLNAMQLVIS